MQHLVELLLLAWFWMTPIVYTYRQVADRMGDWAFVYLLNPMVDVVITFQRALYNILVGPPAQRKRSDRRSSPTSPCGGTSRNLAIVDRRLLGAARASRCASSAGCEGNFAEEI